MCGNFFNPGSGSFLGGPVGRTVASIAGSALLGPEVGALTGLGEGAASSALTGALVGGGLGATGGGGLTGALQGAALGGAGGYLTGGGLSDITNGVSDLLPTSDSLSGFLGGTGDTAGGSDLANLSTTPDTGSAAAAARDAISGTATAAAPAGDILSGYLPAGSGPVAGGGTPGGFFSADADPTPLYPSAVGTASTPGGLTDFLSHPLTSVSDGVKSLFGPTAPADALGNPLEDSTALYPSSVPTGAKPMFSPASLLGGAAKTGLSYLLQNNNTGGYNALAAAGNQQAADYQPFLQAGQHATNTLSDLYGLNGPTAATAATQNWQNTPGYQFALDQGLKALDAGAAARGMLTSGPTLQAEQQYGTGLADQYYQQYLQGLQNQQTAGLAGAQGVSAGQGNAATAQFAKGGTQAGSYNTLLGGLSNLLFPSPGYSGVFNGQPISLNYSNGQGGISSWFN